MSLTFGTIIADRGLQVIGLKSLMLGIFLSILFGFIFGLILGTTEMPWGYNDWPTDEMKGRYISLKMIKRVVIDHAITSCITATFNYNRIVINKYFI